MDNIYNISSAMDDYANLVADGNISWISISSCTSNSREALENWKNRLDEVLMQNYARITKSM